MEHRPRINHQIRVPKVELIDQTGKNLGPADTFQARRMAEEAGLDLVEINPNPGLGKPPLAKIMDYGRYLYDKSKKIKKELKKHHDEIKEIRFGYRIGIHDLKIRANKSEAFLKEGYKVIIAINLRGRELGLAHLAKEKLEKFLGLVSLPFNLESGIKKQPRGWSVIIVPTKQ